MRKVDAGAVLLLCATMMASTSSQAEAPRAPSADTAGQSLVTALTDVARRSGRELVMADVAQASGAAPRLKGRYTPEQALQLLLAGSGLAYRRTADGAYIIYPAPPLAPSEPDNPVSLPELLVTARSRNSDIPRTLAVTYGDTPRFDAATKRVDGRIGFTPDGGRTDVMVAFSDFRGANLRVGERDYPAKARARRYANSRI